MYHKSNCDCYNCKCEKKKAKYPKSEPCCQFKYVNNILGKPGDIVEVIPSTDYKIACVQKVICDKEPEWLWAQPAGGTMNDEGFSIDADCNSNAYVTGRFQGTRACFGQFILSSQGNDDIFVAKLDTNGTWLWAQQAGGIDEDRGLGISVDCQGNSYVTGYFINTITFGNTTITLTAKNDDNYKEVFVAKIDTNGNWLWAEQAGGGDIDDNEGRGISVDCQGNSYVVGNFAGTITFGDTDITLTAKSDNGNDIFVAKLDTNGNWLWAQPAGSNTSFFESGYAISVDCNGSSYITGIFAGTNACFGQFILSSKGSTDIFVAKLDTNGNWLWAKPAGDTSFDEGLGISVDCHGNAYLTGFFQGTNACFGDIILSSKGSIDIFVTKLDTDGNWLWAQSAGDTSSDRGRGISVDCKGNSYVIGDFIGVNACFGRFTLSSKGSGDIFIAKLDTNGNWSWAESAGGAVFDRGFGISVDCNSNVYVTGEFNGTNACFGQFTLSSKGSNDIFVAKISSTNLGTLGFLGDYAQPNQKAKVCFPGGVILEDTFNQDLKPGNKYYIDCKCQLSTCCKCAKQFVGVACDKDKMITGIHDNCCTKH